MSIIKDEFIANYSKKNFWEIWQKILKNLAIKSSIEGPILLAFISLSKMFSKGLLFIAINKVQIKAFVTLHLDHGYIIYDKTCSAYMHQRFGVRWK